jgi:hypothetical protein
VKLDILNTDAQAHRPSLHLLGPHFIRYGRHLPVRLGKHEITPLYQMLQMPQIIQRLRTQGYLPFIAAQVLLQDAHETTFLIKRLKSLCI